MIFWIAVAALAAAVTFAVTRPLAGDSGGDAAVEADAALADIAVYKDQLREIDADQARGAFSVSEADAARNEIARRMIRRAEQQGAAAVTSSTVNAQRWAFAVTSIGLPLASLALYLHFGAPGMPGQPLSARLQAPVDPGKGNDLVAKVEAALRTNPEDGKGWDVIAPVYLAQARFADAASAYATAMRLLGESPARLQGFADARIRADNGLIAEDARKALEQLRKLDPQRTEPRIWLALAKEQDGDLPTAMSEYRAILSNSAVDAPWRKMLEARIAGLEGAASKPAASTGPKPADVAAFEALTPEQRAAKINEMVEGLAARLKVEPKDLDGWQKLIRAYAALGRRDDAMKAAADARAGLSGNDDQIRQLDAWMKDLGLAG